MTPHWTPWTYPAADKETRMDLKDAARRAVAAYDAEDWDAHDRALRDLRTLTSDDRPSPGPDLPEMLEKMLWTPFNHGDPR